jgi:hypothetical protein
MTAELDLEAIVVDGPSAGSYPARRLAARMVFTVDRVTGRRYVLDEDGDQVEPTEDAYVYEHDPEVGVGWLCVRGHGGGCIRTVTYRYAGALNPETGEFLPATPAELDVIRHEGRKRIIAWAQAALRDPEPVEVAAQLDDARERLKTAAAPAAQVAHPDDMVQLDIFDALGAQP